MSVSTLIITPAAELDLMASMEWYESIRPGLSNDFQLAFEATLNFISRHPEASVIVKRDLRRTLLRRFSYAVFYRLHGDALQIVAVLHTSRAPYIW